MKLLYFAFSVVISIACIKAENKDINPCAIRCNTGYHLYFDANGICSCILCPQVDCIDYCQHGYALDENGCTSCKCAENVLKSSTKSTQVLSTITTTMCYFIQNPCNMICTIGYVHEIKDCICRCVPGESTTTTLKPCNKLCAIGYDNKIIGSECVCVKKESTTTEKPLCNLKECLFYMKCANGFVLDKNNCPTCECITTKITCSPIMCDMYCEFGFENDENGCPICKCNQPTTTKKICPLVTCYCPNGYMKDENGCDLCKCVTKPTTTIRPTCSSVMCFMYCEYGFEKDKNGCPICKCNSLPTTLQTKTCSPIRCKIYCEYGFAKDGYGCDVCKCNPKPPKSNNSICPLVKCITCSNGYIIDQKGCQTCNCIKS